MRTAQNSMFQFVKEELKQAEHLGQLESLHNNPDLLGKLYSDVRLNTFELLNIPEISRSRWYIGIIDSGKRAIEAITSYFCPAEQEANIVVATENYVAFNKFSAANALEKQKNISFNNPFTLEMGQALTIGSEEEFKKAEEIFKSNSAKTLWIAWNSTSTGVREKVEDLVACRNRYNSDTVIICDAASYPLFSTSWEAMNSENLPDIFFFSLRKQGLPYDGPQDEANQARNSGCLYVFNDRALKLAETVDGPSLYHTPLPAEAAHGHLTSGEQRSNHIRHLLKLKTSLNVFLMENAKMLREADNNRKIISQEIHDAFGAQGSLTSQGFSLLAQSEAQSQTTFVVKVPEKLQPKEIVEKLKNNGIFVSVSMHPKVPNHRYFRFASYPATPIEEARITIDGLQKCLI